MKIVPFIVVENYELILNSNEDGLKHNAQLNGDKFYQHDTNKYYLQIYALLYRRLLLLGNFCGFGS